MYIGWGSDEDKFSNSDEKKYIKIKIQRRAATNSLRLILERNFRAARGFTGRIIPRSPSQGLF